MHLQGRISHRLHKKEVVKFFRKKGPRHNIRVCDLQPYSAAARVDNRSSVKSSLSRIIITTIIRQLVVGFLLNKNNKKNPDSRRSLLWSQAADVRYTYIIYIYTSIKRAKVYEVPPEIYIIRRKREEKLKKSVR